MKKQHFLTEKIVYICALLDDEQYFQDQKRLLFWLLSNLQYIGYRKNHPGKILFFFCK